MDEHIVIITGSRPISPATLAVIPAEAIVLGVDGGLDVALAAGLEPSGLIGDLDSVSAAGLEWAEAHATIARHPVDKEQTDTELALLFAADMQPARLTMIGGGDRLDHSLAAIGALAMPSLTTVPILEAWWDGQHLDVIHGPSRRTLHLEPGSIVSLLALRERCDRVGITGVQWPLDGHRLAPMIGLGISNQVTDSNGVVDVTVSSGVLTVFNSPAALDVLPEPSTRRSARTDEAVGQ